MNISVYWPNLMDILYILYIYTYKYNNLRFILSHIWKRPVNGVGSAILALAFFSLYIKVLLDLALRECYCATLIVSMLFSVEHWLEHCDISATPFLSHIKIRVTFPPSGWRFFHTLYIVLGLFHFGEGNFNKRLIKLLIKVCQEPKSNFVKFTVKFCYLYKPYG